MTPCVHQLLRGSDRDRAKLRAFLAASRSWISSSTSRIRQAAFGALARSTSNTASKRARQIQRRRAYCRRETHPRPWRCWHRARIRTARPMPRRYSDRHPGRLRTARRAAAGPLQDLFVHAFGILVGLQAQLEIAQPVDRGRRGLQSVDAEIELLAIRHRGQQIPHHLRLIAVGQQVPQGIRNCPPTWTSSAPRRSGIPNAARSARKAST